jgi:hypothetical protein
MQKPKMEKPERGFADKRGADRLTTWPPLSGLRARKRHGFQSRRHVECAGAPPQLRCRDESFHALYCLSRRHRVQFVSLTRSTTGSSANIVVCSARVALCGAR